ncbi:MAG TPA: hypothetical protein VLA32_03960 [Anaerolineales bacterium]|jgi:hypothetical protein|nr:hypothetical protein [Anaerolineales bacterium]
MDKTVRTLVIIAAVVVIATALVGAGFFIGRAAWGWNSFHTGGMMGIFDRADQDPRVGFGMMGGRGFRADSSGDYPYGHGMMGGSYGPGGHGPGMMGGFGFTTDADPLSAEESLEAVEAYLSDFGNDDLAVAEIMVFENNSYAIVKEESTGIGAFELLIDPATKNVFPEYGPNMMWNLKYGMHAGSGFSGHGMMGRGMMGGGMMGDYQYFDGELPDVSAEMPVTAEEALEFAQQYLDDYDPGVTVSDEITAFYGYYTIDLEKDGQLVGMLSVNGFNGQVFPHNWHGTFIEMVETDHD